MKEIFTSALYSTIFASLTLAVQWLTYMPLMFLIVFAASVTAFWAASLQLTAELPINSITFTTTIRFTSPGYYMGFCFLQLFEGKK
jgi:hypothetical protein